MNNLMKYKGYWGSCIVSLEDNILHGKIECINDLVTYEATTLIEIKTSFEEAVDDYLETCELIGKEPDKVMSGSFNIRVGTDIHKKLYIESKKLGMSLNDFVKKSLAHSLDEEKEVHMHLHVPEHKFEKEYISEFSGKKVSNENELKFERRSH